MNLISETHHSCERREYIFMVLREYTIISLIKELDIPLEPTVDQSQLTMPTINVIILIVDAAFIRPFLTILSFDVVIMTTNLIIILAISS